jgi:hypothetical protein
MLISRSSKGGFMNKNDYYTYRQPGYGLELISPDGRTVYLQGDDANNLLDELNAIEANDQFTENEIQDMLIDPYFD